MANRYFVVSDLHLCDIEDHDDGWRYYKASRFVIDDAFERAVRDFEAQADPDDNLTLILNGDIVDFDLVCAVPDDPPWPVNRRERKAGLRATGPKSAWKLRYVLDQHPQFVSTLSRLLSAGHRVVYIIGNHDPELHFEEVQTALRDAILERAARDGATFEHDRLLIEPWFYYVPGVIFAEHGHQYDYYSSFRYILDPLVRSEDPVRIALPMGNLSNRRLMSQMGYFNPHATDYILNIYAYVLHWLRYYAFSRRGLVLNWFFGSIAVLARLIGTRRALLRHPVDSAKLLEVQSKRSGLDLPTLEAIDRLQRPPITNRVFRMVREFWIDRALLASIMVTGTIILALVPVQLWVKLMVPLTCFPLLYFIYEWFAHGESVFSEQAGSLRCARQLVKLLDAPVVAFGHTHAPRLVPLGERKVFVDTGTWAPITKAGQNHVLVPGLRNVLQVVATDDGEVRADLDAHLGPEPLSVS